MIVILWAHFVQRYIVDPYITPALLKLKPCCCFSCEWLTKRIKRQSLTLGEDFDEEEDEEFGASHA